MTGRLLNILFPATLFFYVVSIGLANDIQRDLEYQIVHNARTRYYDVHLPLSFNATKTYPLVIALHGEKANASHMKKMTGFNIKSDEAGFIVVYPQGSGRFQKKVLSWNSANCCGYAYEEEIDDVGFIEAVINKMDTDYHIDPTKIFVTGFSNGAMLAFTLACKLSHRIAAIAPVSGSFNELSCKPEEPISLIMIHGTNDKYIPVDGGIGIAPEANLIHNSVATAVTYWVKHNACDIESNINVKDKITIEQFKNGINGTAVTLYIVRGGWHSWPGGLSSYLFPAPPYEKLSATDVIWDFFKNHPKQP